MLAGGLDGGLSAFEAGGARFSGVGEAVSGGGNDSGGEGEGFVEGMEMREKVVERVETDVEALSSSAC